jgi:hypothetical protein
MSTIHLVIGRVYQCETTNITDTSGHTISAVTGTHFDNKTSADVQLISIYGNWTLSFVPRGMKKFFPNIKALRILRTAIDMLHNDFDDV